VSEKILSPESPAGENGIGDDDGAGRGWKKLSVRGTAPACSGGERGTRGPP